jgi:hypothetical protein
MQRLVEILCEPKELQVVFQAIRPDVELLASHPKGNYVLTALLSIFNNSGAPCLPELLDRLLSQLPSLINDPLGVCVVNKLIECASTTTKTTTEGEAHRLRIVEFLTENFVSII